ncbi:uncharacterized protein [Diabrotica undecimpunctata]|uniref:uncharacterized protein n=1 Tax=Diabrotica undecimpunctata TaxID=50387 RepID=UPI003B641CA9
MMRRYIFSVCLVIFSVTTIRSQPLGANDDLTLRSVLLNQNNEDRYSNKNNFFHYNDGLNGQYNPCGASCQPEIDIYNSPCGGSVCQPGISAFPIMPQIPPIPQIQPIFPQIPPIPPIPQFQPIFPEIPPIPPIPQIQPIFPQIPPIPPIPQIQPIIQPIPSPSFPLFQPPRVSCSVGCPPYY